MECIRDTCHQSLASNMCLSGSCLFLHLPSLFSLLFSCVAFWDHFFTGRPWQFAFGSFSLGRSHEEPTGMRLVFFSPPCPPWKAPPLFLPSGRGWLSMQGGSYCGWVGLTRRPHNKVKFTHSVETGFHWLTALGGGGGGMGGDGHPVYSEASRMGLVITSWIKEFMASHWHKNPTVTFLSLGEAAGCA